MKTGPRSNVAGPKSTIRVVGGGKRCLTQENLLDRGLNFLQDRVLNCREQSETPQCADLVGAKLK